LDGSIGSENATAFVVVDTPEIEIPIPKMQ